MIFDLQFGEALKFISLWAMRLTSGPNVMSAIGNILENAVASQFESEGMYFQKGAPWSGLKESTKRDRLKKGFPVSPILQRHGSSGLLGSIHSKVNRDTIILSAGKSYAVYLHEGTKFMPPRPIFPDQFGLPPDVLEEIQSIFIKANS